MSWIITGTEKNDPVGIENVSLLLHGDGTNGSTTIVDSSPSPKTVTAFGDAQISTAQSKFGGSSIAFDGSGDYLSLADSDDFELGSGDFTIEGWFYFKNTGSSGTTFWGKWNSPNRSYAFSYVKSTGRYTFAYSTNGSAESLLTSNVLSADINTWVHFAVVRNGSSLKVYRNGTSIIDASVGTSTFYNATTDLYIGRLQSNTDYDYNGYIDDLRITKGVARYTSNFTPPTTPFPDA